ncbi:MAG TPA: bifunctional phosphoribosylaminoimidazolecarboxamide formyltransferase/IMP cyclohydrolase PurH, partial [Bacteroidales bacterium]|nr:bifunctional phosphoribosylaminoimidazolecarboxamide formyltransferase/IMP cyclohydrolase PurH [Bacteroidales bacterium]
MSGEKRIQSALLSVYHKDNLDSIVYKLKDLGVTFYSTGGTQEFLESLGCKVIPVEDVTSYPSILGGRVKTLHPKIFGGILARRDNTSDISQMQEYTIPEIDLVIVDLYPFVETVASGASDEAIIEKIDIGGISLIRGAAKNFNDVLIVSSREQYDDVYEILKEKDCSTDLSDRRRYAKEGFQMSSSYDTAIHNYFADDVYQSTQSFDLLPKKVLRYGENPHQAATFYGD